MRTSAELKYPMNPRVIIAITIGTVTLFIYASTIKYPKPRSPDTISAATSENQATPIEICRPVKINGNAPGTTTFLKISHLLEPRQPAALKYSSSIESTPSIAFSVVTKKDANVARNRTGHSKPGRSSIESGTQAKIGICRKTSIRGKI